MISDSNLVKELFIQQAKYCKKSINSYKTLDTLLGEGLVTNLDNKSWSKHRQVISPAFDLQNIQKLMKKMVKITTEKITGWKNSVNEKNEVVFDSIHHELSQLTLNIIFESSFNTNNNILNEMSLLWEKITENFLIYFVLYMIFKQYTVYLPLSSIREYTESITKIKNIVLEIIKEKEKELMKKDYNNDSSIELLSLIMNDTHQFSHKELIDECLTFLVNLNFFKK
jgi:cytochrome P450